MHIGGNGAYRCAEHARDHSVAEAVLARDRAKPRGEGKSVDIGLRRQRPRDIKPRKQTYNGNNCPKHRVADGDGKDVARVLTVRRKRQRGKDNADRRARKAHSCGQGGEHLGQNEHDIQVRDDEKPVDGNIYHTKRHTEFVGKIRAVARAFYELCVVLDAPPRQDYACKQGRGKENEEKYVHKAAVGVGKRKIARVFYRRSRGRVNAERVVHKGVDENAEKSDGKPRLIEIVPSVHGGSAWQKGQHDEADGNAADDGDGKTYPINARDVGVVPADRVAEKHLADEGGKGGREKGDVNVFGNLFLHNGAVQQNADEGRPHIEKIKSVKAVRDDEHISRKRRGVGAHPANENDGVCKQAANGGVEQRAAEPAKREIVGNELARRGQNAAEIVEKIPFLGINDRNRRGK